jgi:chorismate-pyruvate lyase
MKADKTRHITRKTRLNEDEDAMVRRACAAMGKTFGSLSRELLLMASNPVHVRPIPQRIEGPKCGPKSQPRFPGRRAGAHVRMRL